MAARLGSIALIFWLNACSPTTSFVDNQLLKVYYFPFGVETLTPVTMENIDRDAHQCTISSENDRAEIIDIFESAALASRPEDRFHNLTVRVKIMKQTPGGGDVLAVVENQGSARYAGMDKILTANALDRLRSLMEQWCR